MMRSGTNKLVKLVSNGQKIIKKLLRSENYTEYIHEQICGENKLLVAGVLKRDSVAKEANNQNIETKPVYTRTEKYEKLRNELLKENTQASSKRIHVTYTKRNKKED